MLSTYSNTMGLTLPRSCLKEQVVASFATTHLHLPPLRSSSAAASFAASSVFCSQVCWIQVSACVRARSRLRVGSSRPSPLLSVAAFISLISLNTHSRARRRAVSLGLLFSFIRLAPRDAVCVIEDELEERSGEFFF